MPPTIAPVTGARRYSPRSASDSIHDFPKITRYQGMAAEYHTALEVCRAGVYSVISRQSPQPPFYMDMNMKNSSIPYSLPANLMSRFEESTATSILRAPLPLEATPSEFENPHSLNDIQSSIKHHPPTWGYNSISGMRELSIILGPPPASVPMKILSGRTADRSRKEWGLIIKATHLMSCASALLRLELLE